MDHAALSELAREWWADDGSGEAKEYVSDLVTLSENPIDGLIAALFHETPATKHPSFIGISVIENLVYSKTPAARVAQVLRTTGLDDDQLVSVLSGAYADILQELDIRAHLGQHLPKDRIDWLLDASAAGRREHF